MRSTHRNKNWEQRNRREAGTIRGSILPKQGRKKLEKELKYHKLRYEKGKNNDEDGNK